MRRLPAILLFALVVALSGCQGVAQSGGRATDQPSVVTPGPSLSPPRSGSTPSPTGISTPTSQTVSTAILGQPFQITVGQQVAVDHTITVTLDQIAEDSRCPKSVQCFWSGAVEAAVTIQQTGKAAQSFVLTRPSVPDGSDRAAYETLTVQLLDVTPYPETPENKIAQDAYVVTLVVAPSSVLSPSAGPQVVPRR